MKPTEIIAQKLISRRRKASSPAAANSFREFLGKYARVKSGSRHVPYGFEGREALGEIADRVDEILGFSNANCQTPIEETGKPHTPAFQATPSFGFAQDRLDRGDSVDLDQTSLLGSAPRHAYRGCCHSLSVKKHESHEDQKLEIGNSKLAMTDASLAICGGAQFGKTVLMLNLLVYLTAVRFRNVGYYLPDDDLVEGIVDGKLRPDVLDQIPEVAQLIKLGKTLNPSGRAVNRKGALLVTDGKQTALAYLRGMGKVPTTFSMDVVIQDEKDDIAEYNAKFLAGRMTASDLRFSLSIGTQRYHGAGQNREFEEGTQHVGILFPQNANGRPEAGDGRLENPSPQPSPEGRGSQRDAGPGLPSPRPSPGGRGGFGDQRSPLQQGNGSSGASPSSLPSPASLLPLRGICPEEHWPQVCRLSISGKPDVNDPQLTLEGDFCSSSTGEHFPATAMRDPEALVYLADPVTGVPLDRRSVRFVARRPEREAQRKWSYRVSQLIIDAIDLRQIVAAWTEAVRDPEQMTAFCTDRLAMPRSLSQALDPAALQRAREATPYTVILTEPTPARNGAVRYAGLDMGDRCWLVVREVFPISKRQSLIEEKATHPAPYGAPLLIEGIPAREISTPSCRLVWAEMIAAERVRERVPELCTALGVKSLFVDAGPLRDLSRDLCFILADGQRNAFPSPQPSPEGRGGFGDQRSPLQQGSGPTGVSPSKQGMNPQRWDEAEGKWRYLKAAAVEFTLKEGQGVKQKPGVTQEGKLYPLIACNREETIARVIAELQHADGPLFLLPERTAQTPPILATFEQHLLSGSRQERSSDGKSMHFVDKCENHFLLATAYAALAQRLDILESGSATAPPSFYRVPRSRGERAVQG